MSDNIQYIKKKTLENGIIEIAYTTFKDQNRTKSGTTTFFFQFPKELADLIKEK